MSARKLPAKTPGPKTRQNKKARAVATAGDSAGPRFRAHPLYGQIPLLPQTTTYQGKTYTYWIPDPNWHPPLPKGAVRGNPQAQNYSSMWAEPKYFYVDQLSLCVQCRQEFIFAAAEQKFWYEQLKFNFYATAIRCPTCRRQRRSLKSLLHGVQAAAAQMAQSAQQPEIQLAYADALIKYHAQTGQGDLNKALAACRQARKRDPGLAEAWYLEALAQHLKGNDNKVTECYQAFLKLPCRRPAWKREAMTWLAEHPPVEVQDGSLSDGVADD